MRTDTGLHTNGNHARRARSAKWENAFLGLENPNDRSGNIRKRLPYDIKKTQNTFQTKGVARGRAECLIEGYKGGKREMVVLKQWEAVLQSGRTLCERVKNMVALASKTPQQPLRQPVVSYLFVCLIRVCRAWQVYTSHDYIFNEDEIFFEV